MSVQVFGFQKSCVRWVLTALSVVECMKGALDEETRKRAIE